MTDIDFLKQEEVISFIRDNATVDINTLLLNPPRIFREKIQIIASQIVSRQKALGKLNPWLEMDRLIFPPPISVEQASSITTATYKKNLINGNVLVDLTGGSGVDTLILSDNFKDTTYVEQNPDLCNIFSHNLAEFRKNIRVVNQHAEFFLKQFHNKATFYLDPARRDDSKRKVFKLEDCTPNIIELLPALQRNADGILIKLSPLLDLSKTINEVSHVKEVHIVSVKNDCKELLLLIDFGYLEEPDIYTVNLDTNQEQFDFKLSLESTTKIEYHQTETYLYEPNASILKAGAFKTIASKYGVNKISPNTHLYSSNSLVANFPGKTFQILHYDGKSKLKSGNGLINVLTRNYPLSSTQLKKKFNLNDGGSEFLIGFRDHKDKPQLVIAKRL